MSKKKYDCTFYHVTDIVPEDWRDWFYSEAICSDFTWGDSNHTLVSISDFKEACERGITPDEDGIPSIQEITDFLNSLDKLDQSAYIDLEN